MKTKKSKLIAFAVACILAICAIAVAACDFKFRSKELVDLKIDTANVQTVFHPGDEFNSDNLVVTAHYDDGSKVVLKSGYHVRDVAIDHVTTDETRAEGRDSVRVVYGEKETTYDVTISQVASLRLDTGAVQKSFRQDAPFTYDKLKVYARYTDGTERLLESGEYSATADTGRTGSATATVTATFPVFGEKGAVVSQAFTANYQISVQAHNLKSIYVKEGPATKDYFVGDEFDPAGLEVYGVFEGEADRLVEGEFTFTADGLEDGVFTKAGNIEVTVHDGDLTATFSVNVTAVALDKIEISTPASKLEFFTSETFTAEGLAITATYNNKTTKVVTYTEAENNGLTVVKPTMSAGSQQVTVKFTDGGVTKDVTYNITVKAVVLDRIELGGTYAKEFFAGDTLDYDGLTVTAVYNDGNSKPVESGFTVTANNLDGDKLTVQSDTVTVSYEDGGVTKDATYKITVQAVVVESLMLGGEYNTDFYVGDEFNHDGLTVTAHFNHGDDQVVTEKAEVSKPDLTSAGKKQVTVTYGAGEAIYTVTVYNKLTGLLVTDSVKEYKEGNNFDQSTLTVKALYNDAADGETVEGFTVKGAPDGALEAHEYTVTVEYTVDDAENFNRGTATKEYTFNVKATTVTHTVTVTLVPEEGGSYTLDVEGGVYEEGATATLTVTCNPEYAIQSVKNGAADLSANEEGKYTVEVNDDIEITVTFVKKSLSNFNNYDFGAPARLSFYLAYTGYSAEELYAAVLLIGEREVNRVDHFGAAQLFYFDLPTDLAKGTNDLSIKMPDGQIFKITFDPSNFANTHNNSLELDGTVFTFGLSAENQMQLTVAAAERTVTITGVDPAEGSITVKNGDNEVHSGDKVPVGTELTIEVKAADGYVLENVTADGNEIDIAEETGTGTYLVEKDVTITATFRSEGATTRKVNVTVSGEGGNYELNPPAEGDEYEIGSQVTLTVKPDTHYGYEITITGADYTSEGDVFTITIGDSAVTVTITFFEKALTQTNNNVLNAGGLDFFATVKGYKFEELEAMTYVRLIVGETEVEPAFATPSKNADGTIGIHMNFSKVFEVKTAGVYELKLRFGARDDDVYNFTMSIGYQDGDVTVDDFKYELRSREGDHQLILTITDKRVPVEESISVTPNEKKYAVGETFKAEDFTVTYTSSTGETSTLSLGDDGYTVHLGAKDGALVNEEYSFDEATELTLVFVYNDLEFSVTVTVTEKVEVREVKITKLEFYADLYAHLEMSQDDFAVVKDAARMTTNGVQTVFENNKGFLVDGTRLNVMVDAANKDVYEFVWYNADEQVIARGTYTKESGGDVDEKAYELAKVEIKELDGSIWYVLSGTFSGYADSELTELLNTIHFDFQYNSAVVLGINDDYSRADTIADLTRKVTCSNGNWELRFDIHNVETYAYHAHWDGIQAIDPSAPNNDFKVSTEIAADGVETRYDGRIYTLINKNGQSGVLNYWGCVGLRITDIFTPSTAEDVGSYKKLECDVGTSLWNDGGANYRGESEAVADASKNQWSYWYVAEDGWGECGEKLASANLTTDGSHIIVEYSGGSVNFSVQVFYDHAGLLTHGKEYVLRFKLIASANCTVNSSNGGDAFNVPQNSDGYVVTFRFTYDSAKSMFCLQLPGSKLTGQERMTFEIFDVEWYDVDPDEEVPGIISGFSDAGLETNDEGTVAYYTVTLESSGIGADAQDDFTLFDGDVTFDCEKAEVVEGGLKLYFDVTARELGKTWFFPHLKYKGAPWNGSDGNINVADFDEKKITVGFKEYRMHCNTKAEESPFGMPVFEAFISPKAYTVDWNGIKLAVEDGKAILTIKGTIAEGAPEYAIEADLQKHNTDWKPTERKGSATYEGRNWTLKIDITDVAVYDDDIYIVHIYFDGSKVDVDFGGGSAEGFIPGDAFTEAEKTFQLGTAENLFNDGRTFLTVSIKTAEGGGEQVKEVVLELTQKALGLTTKSYADNNKDHTVGDFTFATNQAMAISTNIQMQKKSKGNAYIENKTAFPGRIKSIVIVFTSSSGEITLELGNTTEYDKSQSITMSGTQTFTADEGTNFRFFKLYDPTETATIVSIKITYLVSTVVCSHSSLTKTDGTPAGCETPGTEDYWTCDKCNRMFNTGENPTDDNEIFAPVKIEALGHSYTEWEDDGDGMHHTSTCDRCHTQQFTEVHDKDGEGGKCSKCGATVTGDVEEKLLATFDLGSATADDNNAEYKNQYTETNGSYTLTLESPSKVYPGKGGTLKLGSGTAAGKFSFTVPDNVSMVKIYVGQYSGKSVQITINGTTYSVTKNSDNSNGAEFECFEIDTTSVKKIEFATKKPSSGDYRVRIDKIEFYGTDSAAAAASTTLVSATPDLFVEDKH